MKPFHKIEEEKMKLRSITTLIIIAIITSLSISSRVFAETHNFSQMEMEHAMAVHSMHVKELFELPGVHGVGIGESSGKLGIVILVDDESELKYIPKSVGNMPAAIHVVGEITAHTINLGVSGGNSLICNGYCAGGTVGFKVCDNTTTGVDGIVTNNHVAASGCPGLCPNNSPIGTAFFSPGVIDTKPVCSTTGAVNIGSLRRFVPLVLDGLTTNYVDAALVQSTDAFVSNNIHGLGVQNNTVVAPSLGQAVCKSGRTSGVTCGTVTGINMTVNVNYGQPCGTARFSNAIMYSPTAPYTVMSQPGDSGSPVVNANTNAAVALNFAGTQSGIGIGNPIGAVLSALQVSLCSSSTWVSISGATASSPALAWNPVANELHMVVRASDGTLWAATFNSNGVFNNDWVNVPGLTASTPALAWNAAANKLQLVVRASNNTLWAATFTSSGVFNNDWESIAGLTDSPPALAWNPSANNLFMVVKASDGSIWTSTFSSTGTFNNNWAPISGMTASPPALAWNPVANEIQMVIRASNNTLWGSTFSPSGVFNNDWVSMPGLTPDTPAIAWDGFDSNISMIVRASDNTMWSSTFSSTGSFNNDWANFPGQTVSAPALAYLPSIGYIETVVRAADNSLWTILY